MLHLGSYKGLRVFVEFDLIFIIIFVFDRCEFLAPFNILFKTKPGSFRLTDSRDIPMLDTSDYSGNWQNKVLER